MLFREKIAEDDDDRQGDQEKENERHRKREKRVKATRLAARLPACDRRIPSAIGECPIAWEGDRSQDQHESDPHWNAYGIRTK